MTYFGTKKRTNDSIKVGNGNHKQYINYKPFIDNLFTHVR